MMVVRLSVASGEISKFGSGARARCIKDENARVQMEHALDIPKSVVGISPAYIPHHSRGYVNTPEGK